MLGARRHVLRKCQNNTCFDDQGDTALLDSFFCGRMLFLRFEELNSKICDTEFLHQILNNKFVLLRSSPFLWVLSKFDSIDSKSPKILHQIQSKPDNRESRYSKIAITQIPGTSLIPRKLKNPRSSQTDHSRHASSPNLLPTILRQAPLSDPYVIQIPPKSPPANEILRQSRAKRRRAVGTVAVINRREARRRGGRVADRRETVIESRAARAFRRIAGRRVFPASNQAGIHRICCQSAAPSPSPPPRV